MILLLVFILLIASDVCAISGRHHKDDIDSLQGRSGILAPLPVLLPSACKCIQLNLNWNGGTHHPGIFPLTLFYDSRQLNKGLFGNAWKCPQLESKVLWNGNEIDWLTPWGETISYVLPQAIQHATIRKWRITYRYCGFPQVVVFNLAEEAPFNWSFLYVNGLLKRVERTDFPAFVLDYEDGKPVCIRHGDSIQSQLSYDEGRVCRVNDFCLTYGESEIGLLSGDGRKVSGARKTMVLQGYIDEQSKMEAFIDYSFLDHLPRISYHYPPGYPKKSDNAPREPERSEIEDFNYSLLLDGSRVFLCLSGEYLHDGMRIGNITIKEQGNEGMLHFHLVHGNQANFNFKLEVPKSIKGIFWNGRIFCGIPKVSNSTDFDEKTSSREL